MNKTLCICVLFASVALCEAKADEPDERQRIVEYFEITGVEDSLQRQIDSMKKEARGHYAGYPPVFWQDLERLYDRYKADVFDAYVDVADEHLTVGELESLIEFLDTELGRKFLLISQRLQPEYDKAVSIIYADWLDDLQNLVDEHAP